MNHTGSVEVSFHFGHAKEIHQSIRLLQTMRSKSNFILIICVICSLFTNWPAANGGRAYNI